MKRIAKILFFLSILIATILIASYFIFFTKIEIDNAISKSREIKNLDHKIFWNLGYFKPEKISTDYSDYKKEDDTVQYTFDASLSPKTNQIGSLILNSSTGFGGQSVYIYKIGNRFRTEIKSYSDNGIENDLDKGFKILTQKLILDKESYKISDSIFGKIEIKYQNNSNNSINEANGFFRGKID